MQHVRSPIKDKRYFSISLFLTIVLAHFPSWQLLAPPIARKQVPIEPPRTQINIGAEDYSTPSYDPNRNRAPEILGYSPIYFDLSNPSDVTVHVRYYQYIFRPSVSFLRTAKPRYDMAAPKNDCQRQVMPGWPSAISYSSNGNFDREKGGMMTITISRHSDCFHQIKEGFEFGGLIGDHALQIRDEYLGLSSNIATFPILLGEVTLQTHRGHYVGIDRFGRMDAYRPRRGAPETFMLLHLSGVKNAYVALLASNRKLVSANGGRGRPALANQRRIGTWEMFALRSIGSSRGNRWVALSSNGSYLSSPSRQRFLLTTRNFSATERFWMRFLNGFTNWNVLPSFSGK
ncbi:MAG: hypothetical protein HY537_03220 [Deltaproteobacteria bacterium]|nr:hypothetical protein [Deltaproteobacteria bacterium]